MWDPKLYALIYCVGMLGRWSYRAGLRQIENELDTWLALVTFWIPLVGVIVLGGSYLLPAIRRRWSRR
jgi:hypothetical protein